VSDAPLHPPAVVPLSTAGLDARLAATTTPVGFPPASSSWVRILAAVRRYKLLVAIITVAGSLASLVAVRLLPPVYVASATIWVQAGDRGGDRDHDALAPIQTAQLLGTAGGWLDLVRSHAVLIEVVRQFRLYLQPKSPADTAALATLTVLGDVRPGTYRLEVDKTGRGFTLSDVKADVVVQQGTVGDSIGGSLGLAWVPRASTLLPKTVVRFTITGLSDAALRLSASLRIRATADGYFIRLERRGKDPGLITTTVNGVADRLVVMAADLKRERRTELASILREQRDSSQAQLRTAESALARFRVEHAVGAGEGSAQGPDGRRITADPMFANYVDLHTEMDGLARDREAITDILARAGKSGLAVDQLLMIGAVQRSTVLASALKELADQQTELRNLRFRYADTHPPVRRLAQQIDTTARYVIPELGATVVVGLATRERDLRRRSDSIARALQGAPPVALEELRLTRDQANAAQLFSDLEQRYNEARVAEVSTLPDIRILEHAVRPNRPVVNAAPFVFLLVFATSLTGGVFAAAWRDRVDPTLRDPQEIIRSMGLAVLGVVPHVQRTNGKRTNGKRNGINNDDEIRAVEALRGVRLNVQHAYGAAGPVLITITSPGRSDGKSFMSANLAHSFAQTGYRTLLIDGDVRCGGLHRIMKGARRPGLTDVLSNHVPADQVVQTTPYPLLSFIGGGSRMYSGPELLSSEAVPRLLTALRPHYDVILVDSAPLAAGVDAYALGTATGSLLMVLRTGVTDRVIAAAKAELLKGLPIRVLGVVMNGVLPGPAYNYYAYSLTGYEVREEDPDGKTASLLPSRS
jgi:tyrosine-protein kinase Etk/Wzc